MIKVKVAVEIFLLFSHHQIDKTTAITLKISKNIYNYILYNEMKKALLLIFG